MKSKPTEQRATTWHLPYDNTALRERIGDTEVVARSVVAELHSAARTAVTTDAATRGRWTLKRRQR